MKSRWFGAFHIFQQVMPNPIFQKAFNLAQFILLFQSSRLFSPEKISRGRISYQTEGAKRQIFFKKKMIDNFCIAKFTKPFLFLLLVD